jgi:hypothetical protein
MPSLKIAALPWKAIMKIPIKIEVKVSSLTAAEVNSAYRTKRTPEVLGWYRAILKQPRN